MLAELDPALFQAQVKQSEANVLAAQAAALDLARIKIDRIIALQRKNLVAKEELDIARQQVDAATTQLKLAEAQLERDRINRRNSVIRAPISGVVFRRLNVERGITLLLVTHEPDITQYAQCLVRFKDGRIVHDGEVHV